MSCAASKNNKTSPKRKKVLALCQSDGCLSLPSGPRAKLCLEHNLFYVDYDKLTIGDMKKNRTAHRFSTIIRHKARKAFSDSDKPAACIFCGYSLSVEIAHIRAISSFALDTPVSAINDISNLEAMCRNHHWEFDNGHIKLSEALHIFG